MTDYSDEVQKVLDTPVVKDGFGSVDMDTFYRACEKVQGFEDFCNQLYEDFGSRKWCVVDAAAATQFKDELDVEDYLALMTQWWKAIGKDDWAIHWLSLGARMAGNKFHRGEYISEPINPSPFAISEIADAASELGVAKSAPKTPRRATLEEAADLIDGDRNKDYGEPLENHQRIADLWAVVFGHEVTPAQVAIAMALVKVARLVYTPDHHDSFVDAAAYLAIADEIVRK